MTWWQQHHFSLTLPFHFTLFSLLSFLHLFSSFFFRFLFRFLSLSIPLSICFSFFLSFFLFLSGGSLSWLGSPTRESFEGRKRTPLIGSDPTLVHRSDTTALLHFQDYILPFHVCLLISYLFFAFHLSSLFKLNFVNFSVLFRHISPLYPVILSYRILLYLTQLYLSIPYPTRLYLLLSYLPCIYLILSYITSHALLDPYECMGALHFLPEAPHKHCRRCWWVEDPTREYDLCSVCPSYPTISYPTISCVPDITPLYSLHNTSMYSALSTPQLIFLSLLKYTSFFHTIGGWSTLMDLMSSLGIICAVAIVCFTEEELGEYTLFERVVIFLLAEQLLLIFKFFLQILLPAEAEWVEEMAARNVHIRFLSLSLFEFACLSISVDSINILPGMINAVDVTVISNVYWLLYKYQSFSKSRYNDHSLTLICMHHSHHHSHSFLIILSYFCLTALLLSDKFAKGVEDEEDDLDINTLKGELGAFVPSRFTSSTSSCLLLSIVFTVIHFHWQYLGVYLPLVLSNTILPSLHRIILHHIQFVPFTSHIRQSGWHHWCGRFESNRYEGRHKA